MSQWTAEQHKAGAERLLDTANAGGSYQDELVRLARAQVHATLATIPEPVFTGWQTEQPGQAY